METIDKVLSRHEQRLMAVPGVVGVGETEEFGQPTILIMVNAMTPDLRRTLPQHLDGFPVKVEVSGEVSAF